MNSHSPHTITAREAAARLDTTIATIQAWCRRGLLQGAERILDHNGALWIIPEAALINFNRPKRGRPRTGSNHTEDK